MPAFRRMRRSVATILLVLYLPGCGEMVFERGDSSGPEGIAGTYTLQTVDGEGPPWATMYGWQQVEVDRKPLLSEKEKKLVSATLRLNEDGTCSWTNGWRVTEVRRDFFTGALVSTTVDTVDAIPQACTYTVAGNSVTFTFFDPKTVRTGTIAGDVLTIVWDGGNGVRAMNGPLHDASSPVPPGPAPDRAVSRRHSRPFCAFDRSG